MGIMGSGILAKDAKLCKDGIMETVILPVGKAGRGKNKFMKLKNPILITGLPGIGLIGKTVALHLIGSLHGDKIAEMYSPYFPHEAIMQNNGMMRLVGCDFYRVRAGRRDLLVLVGDVQPIGSVGQYNVVAKILDYANRMGVKEIITIGGYSAGKILKKGRVFGVANNTKIREKFEKHGVLFGKISGAIVGIAGILPALAKFRKIPSICILGETHGGYIDVIAARRIVLLLSKYLNIKIDMSDIEKKARETEMIIKEMEKEVNKEKMDDRSKWLSYIR